MSDFVGQVFDAFGLLDTYDTAHVAKQQAMENALRQSRMRVFVGCRVPDPRFHKQHMVDKMSNGSDVYSNYMGGLAERSQCQAEANRANQYIVDHTAALTALDAEIVVAAEALVAAYDNCDDCTRAETGKIYVAAKSQLSTLVHRRRALLKPKDAVEMLLDAVASMRAGRGGARAVVEAADRVRKERGK